MTPERWGKVKDVCYAALERPDEVRAFYLGEACGDDADLRSEVEALIASYESDPGFLEQSPQYPMDGAAGGVVDPWIGQALGPYRVIRSIAFGGMGAVYLAERADASFHKQVAVKLLRSDRFLSSPRRREAMLRRFHAERQTLARLEHPNIARLLDGGAAADGTPYLIMEYIEGKSIHHYCDTRNLSIDKRLRLFQDVCGAVHFAHQRLVVHRDIKPSNILVTEDGAPKLLDFGIAKLLEPHDAEGNFLTRTADQPMTPEYASPEQVRNEPLTTASDIYSLGVVLYELLSGHRPYRLHAAPRADIARVICDHEPEKPSTAVSRIEQEASHDGGSTTVTPESVSRTRADHPERLRRRLAGDLDWITMKALDKDYTRRYATAGDLASDIARHLEHQPVLAGPPSAAYRLKKFIRRHRVGATAAAVVALALVGGAMGTTWQGMRAIRERDRAIAAERLADERLADAEAARIQAESVTLFLSGMLAAVSPGAKGRDVTARELLDEASKSLGAGKFKDQPLLEARLRDTIGIAYGQLGEFDAAEQHLVAAVQIGHRVLGEHHRDTLTWTNDLASALARGGRLDEAHTAAQRTFEVRRRVLGESDPATLQSKHNLVMHLYNQGKWSEAARLARETVEAVSRARGEEHPETLRAMYGLAINLSSLGDRQAEPILRKTLEVQGRVLRQEHPETLRTMIAIATELYNQGDFAKAAAMFRQAVDVQRRVLGGDHPETARSLNNLALCLYELGERVEADDLGREALAIKQRRLDSRHPDVLASQDTLAASLALQGRWTEAETLAQEVLSKRRDVHGPDHPQTFTAMDRVAFVLSGQGRMSAAEEVYREVLAGRRRVLGDRHPETLTSLANLATTLRDQGEVLEAESLFREALAARRERGDDEHPATALALHNYGLMLTKLGRSAEAEPLLREALEIRLAKFGEKHETAAATHAALEALRAKP